MASKTRLDTTHHELTNTLTTQGQEPMDTGSPQEVAGFLKINREDGIPTATTATTTVTAAAGQQQKHDSTAEDFVMVPDSSRSGHSGKNWEVPWKSLQQIIPVGGITNEDIFVWACYIALPMYVTRRLWQVFNHLVWVPSSG